MKENLKKIILVIFVIIIAFVYAHVDKKYYLYDRNQDTSEYISTGILENESISQEFIAGCDKIDGIEVKGTVSGDVTNVDVEYCLISKESGEILEKGTIIGSEFKNSRFYKIRFDEIKDAKDKTFIFVLKETGSDDINGIGFSIASKNNKIADSELIVKDNRTEGVLVARVLRNGFDLETFVVFLIFIIYIVVFMKILYKLFK